MLKPGTFAVYPGHGVVKVKRVENKTVGDKAKQFYVLEVVLSQMTILCPVDQAGDYLRAITSKDKAKVIFESLDQLPKSVERTTWNRRYREYFEKIKTGEIEQVAEVYRNLMSIRNATDLSFGERKMLDQCKYLLVSELAIALDTSETKLESQLMGIRAV